MSRTCVSILLITATLALSLVGCEKRAGEPEGPDRPSIKDAPEITINKASKHVYRYYPLGERKAKLAATIDAIPEESRDVVLVIPDEDESDAGLSYVADLREELADGSYPYRVVYSNDFEKTLDETRGDRGKKVAAATPSPPKKDSTPKPPAGNRSDIVMFSTSWCGACAQARRWLRNKSIPYTERDVEKDRGARADMERRADKARYPRSQLSGVPVFWVKGKMRTGFDAQWVMSALGKS